MTGIASVTRVSMRLRNNLQEGDLDERTRAPASDHGKWWVSYRNHIAGSIRMRLLYGFDSVGGGAGAGCQGQYRGSYRNGAEASRAAVGCTDLHCCARW